MQLPVILPKDCSGGMTGAAVPAPGLFQTNTSTPSTDFKPSDTQVSQTRHISSLEQGHVSSQTTTMRTWSIPVFNNTSCSFQPVNQTSNVVSDRVSQFSHENSIEIQQETETISSKNHRNIEAERTKAAFTLPSKMNDPNSTATTSGVLKNRSTENAFSQDMNSKVPVTNVSIEHKMICTPQSLSSEKGIGSRARKKDLKSDTNTGRGQNKRKSSEVSQEDTFGNKQLKLQSSENQQPVFAATQPQKYILPKKVDSKQEVKTGDKTLITNNNIQSKKGAIKNEVHDKSSSYKTDVNAPFVSNKLIVLNPTKPIACVPIHNTVTKEPEKSSRPINTVHDHHLLTKPISFEEANSLISKRKLDLTVRFEKSNQAIQSVGSSISRNFSPWLCSNNIKEHQENSRKEDVVLKNSQLTPKEHGQDGSNEICNATMHNKQTEQQELIHNSSDLNEHFKPGNFRNKKGQTFYIINSGNNKKPNPITTEKESNGVDNISNQKLKIEKEVVNNKGMVSSYKLKRLLIAPGTQTGHANVQLLPKPRELLIKNDLVFKGYSISKNVVTSDKNKKANLNNKPCYNSKLTVAQLLKNKRGEERLETILKSDLNKSCIANTKGEENSKGDTLANTICYKEKHRSKTAEKAGSEIDKSHKSMIEQANKKQSKHEASENKKVETAADAVIECNKKPDMVYRSTPVKLKVGQTCTDINDQSPRSFSVKLGTKMVVMKRNTPNQSPSQTERRKLPPPKSTNQCDKLKDHDTELGEKTKARSEKNIFVENLYLMPRSGLVKNVQQKTSAPETQYTSDPIYTARQSVGKPYSIETGPSDSKRHPSQYLSATILQIWKEHLNSFKHTSNLAEIELLTNNYDIFRRWHEFSDYPCVIKFTKDGKITKIITAKIEPGFFLVTKTTTRQPSVLNETYDIFCILSRYPPNLSDLPDHSMAICISNMSGNDGASPKEITNVHVDLLKQTDKCPTKDDRYSSIIEADMSPRSTSPVFYSRKLQTYFSDLHKIASYASTKETKYANDVEGHGVRSSGKLKGCNSKVEALKKKQKDLLKTCRKFTTNRNIKSVINKCFNVSTQVNVEHCEDDDQCIDVM